MTSWARNTANLLISLEEANCPHFYGLLIAKVAACSEDKNNSAEFLEYSEWPLGYRFHQP